MRRLSKHSALLRAFASAGVWFATCSGASWCGVPPAQAEGAGQVGDQPTYLLPVVKELPPLSPIPAPDRIQIPETPPSVVEQAVSTAAPALGSLSLGLANRGALFNAVQLNDSPFVVIEEPRYSWGTEETIRAISNAVGEVQRLFPGSPRLHIGHLSREYGGWLRPHRSHQSGRDVDLGLYYRSGEAWYVPATEQTLDAKRTWALISALVKAADVEYIFLSRMLHEVLRAEASRIGESDQFIVRVFDGIPGFSQPLLRHAYGHQNHLHVRFQSPAAVANGKRVRNRLGRAGRSYMTANQVLRARRKSARL